MNPRACVATFVIITTASGAAAQDAPEVVRPKPTFLRYREDWSVMRDLPADQRSGWPDAIKYVSFNDDGSVWGSFGGHVRMRGESWSGFGFGAPSDDDDTYLLSRVALHADLYAGDNFRFFIEGKSALSTDRDLPGGRRTLDVDSLALEQAFVDIKLPWGDDGSITLRPGRQQFSFGKQRLVSPLPWANTLRRWDGVSVIVERAGWTVHGFWSQFAPVQKYEFNDPDAQTQFFGAYATGRIPNWDAGIDLYFLGLNRDDDVMFNGTVGDEDRYTIGGRLFGQCGNGYDYDIEGAYQFGDVGSDDIDAFMVAAQVGQTFPDAWGGPRVFLGFDYASGDDSPGGDVETFNQLFPLGHAYYGFIDTIGRQNAVDLSVGATAKPWKKTSLHLSGHFLWRASDDDALYNAGGGVVRPGGLGSSSEIGIEVDFTAKYQFTRELAALFGYSHFFAGDFIDQSGANDDIDFFYLQMQYTF